MRHIILPILLVFTITITISSCSTYQYMTVDSSQLSKNNDKQFTWENDTMRLIYSINGKDGPFRVDVYNKTNQPLYVNWKKSALIRDERSTSYFNTNVTIYGASTSVGYNIGRIRVTNGTSVSNFSLPEGLDFIPPGAGISKDLPPIAQTGELLTYISDSIPKEKIFGPDGVYQAKYQRVRYDESQSPIRFKSYITFSLGTQASPEFAVTHSFYVGQVLQTGAAPELFVLYHTAEGDNAFIKRSAQ
jgi:hypothetical protein